MTYVKVDADGDLGRILGSAHLVYLTSTQDDTAVVLRAQLIAEECAALWISKFTAAPGALGNIGFAQKLTIARHLGLPADLAAAMSTLNKMRNAMAHELDKSTIDATALVKLKLQVEAISLPRSTPPLENPVQTGMPRDGVALSYHAASTSPRERLAIIFDAFIIRFFVVLQAALLASRRALSI